MKLEIEVSEHLTAKPIEIVERKGLGHPDTICDCVSERLSVALSRYYLDHFGAILHHNVDKALLCAGQSEPAFKGGRILRPLTLVLAGRATTELRGQRIPIEDIARETAKGWFHENLHAFDVDRGMRLSSMVGAGSPDLVELFVRQQKSGCPLANDTSIGVGFAPFSELERLVLAVEAQLNAPAFKAVHPESGEDIKIMGLRQGGRITLTVSCAFIGRHLNGLDAYRTAKEEIAHSVTTVCKSLSACEVEVRVNAADDLGHGVVYLTVGGTSGECGDDGEVGRGNRPSGLITPFRPMTMEAMAGKNPVTHVGKLYNALAFRMARRAVDEQPEVESCQCALLSEIGRPIAEPRLAYVHASTATGRLSPEGEQSLRDIAEAEIASTTVLWRDFLAGQIPIA